MAVAHAISGRGNSPPIAGRRPACWCSTDSATPSSACWRRDCAPFRATAWRRNDFLLNRELMPDLNEPRAAAGNSSSGASRTASSREGRAAFNAGALRVGPRTSRPMGPVTRFTAVGWPWRYWRFRVGRRVLRRPARGRIGLIRVPRAPTLPGLLFGAGNGAPEGNCGPRRAGAGRARLVQQLMTEGLWIALLGTAAGLLMMWGWTELLSRVSLPIAVPFELHAAFDARVLAYSAGLLLFTTVLCGLAPALQATRPTLFPALSRTDRTATAAGRSCALLVIGQVAVALMLLVTSMLFLRNLGRAQLAEPGFDTAHTMVAQIGFVEGRYTRDTRAAFLDEAVHRLGGVSRHRARAVRPRHPVDDAQRHDDRRGAAGRRPWRAVQRQVRGQSASARTTSARWAFRSTAGASSWRPITLPRRPSPSSTRSSPGATRQWATRSGSGCSCRWGRTRATAPRSSAALPTANTGRSVKAQQPAVYESFLQRGNRGRLVHVIVRMAPWCWPLARDVQQVLTRMDSRPQRSTSRR